ncbi:MAG: M16 family metallopeptidase [Promethearchaeota archaeon]
MLTDQSESVILDNNLRLQLVSIPGGKTTLIAVGLHAGAMYEEGFGPGSNDGISHFIEHMFFKGTPTKTTKQVNEAFTRLGADLNAYTTYDHTAYHAKVPSRNLHKAIEIWKELLVNKNIDSTEFNAEKEVILQEIQLYADMPEFDVNFTVRKKHLSGTALEHNILGTLDSVADITPDMMFNYIERFYSFDNAIVTLVGGFDLEAEKQYLTSIFSDPIAHPRKHPIYPPNVDYLSPKNVKSNISFYKNEISKPLSYIALAWTCPGIRSTDFFPLLLLNTFIGNSRTSLLYREVISKGIASICRYGFEALYDVSISSILFVTPPKKTEEVFQKVIDLMITIRDLKISPQITNTLKEEVWGSYISEIEDPSNYGIDLLQKYVKFHQPLSVKEFQKEIFQINPEDIQNAKDNLLENFNITVYATGTVPPNWEPQFPKHGPW